MYPTTYLGALSNWEFIFLVGQGVDSGPSDIGHELHAKIEEAAEKALALITHAGKYPWKIIFTQKWPLISRKF